MRRATLADAIARIGKDLKDASVPDIVQSAVHNRQAQKQERIFPLEAFQKYILATSDYGQVERKILEIFSLLPLLDSSGWERMWDGSETDSVIPIYRGIRDITDFLPRVLQLISQDYVSAIKSESVDVPLEIRGKELINVILVEEEGVFSSISRIIDAMQAVRDLYYVHSQVNGDSDDEPIFLACDSGSDKSFDILGAAQSVASLKETIIFIWNSIVFHRHSQARAKLDVLAQSLPVLAQISDLEQTGKVAPELAEQLRRKAISACGKFVDAGAIIPELDREAAHSPRQLMAPERKMLAGPVSVSDSEFNDAQNSDLISEKSNEDDDEDIKALLADMKRRLDAAESRSSKLPIQTTKRMPKRRAQKPKAV